MALRPTPRSKLFRHTQIPHWQHCGSSREKPSNGRAEELLVSCSNQAGAQQDVSLTVAVAVFSFTFCSSLTDLLAGFPFDSPKISLSLSLPGLPPLSKIKTHQPWQNIYGSLPHFPLLFDVLKYYLHGIPSLMSSFLLLFLSSCLLVLYNRSFSNNMYRNQRFY